MKLIVIFTALLSLSSGSALALDNSTTKAGSGLGWSSCSVRQCKNKCVDTYPSGGGPLVTCRQLCEKDACSVVFNVKKGTVKTFDNSPAVLTPDN